VNKRQGEKQSGSCFLTLEQTDSTPFVARGYATHEFFPRDLKASESLDRGVFGVLCDLLLRLRFGRSGRRLWICLTPLEIDLAPLLWAGENVPDGRIGYADALADLARIESLRL